MSWIYLKFQSENLVKWKEKTENICEESCRNLLDLIWTGFDKILPCFESKTSASTGYSLKHWTKCWTRSCSEVLGSAASKASAHKLVILRIARVYMHCQNCNEFKGLWLFKVLEVVLHFDQYQHYWPIEKKLLQYYFESSWKRKAWKHRTMLLTSARRWLLAVYGWISSTKLPINIGISESHRPSRIFSVLLTKLKLRTICSAEDVCSTKVRYSGV